MRPLLSCLVLCAVMPFAAHAQSVHTFTQSQTGSGLRPLGYPVPTPVASLTPVDGFRDYASLDARLQALDADSDDLLGHIVGQTHNGRNLRAYVVSDSDVVDSEGRAEAAFFINAATHAREWAAPEVSTYLVERMMAGRNDQGLVRYLLDNTRLVIIPVHNIDGFLQTQRFPTQAVVGQDPRNPGDWPRDGRMRRKNMRGVDEVLTSFNDHLLGVDLNRNHPPFFGSTSLGGQLTNPLELTFRGSTGHSEAENIALERAAQLAPESRIRLGIDMHSFSAVFFSSNTGRTRLNQIQARLISVISQHHMQVPTSTGAANGKFYNDRPDPPNSGIGVAAEYFAYSWFVPSWTLELEPTNGGSEYGGTNESHSGFVLPASQIRRVREAWAESHLVAFYFMAGPPHLQRVRFYDAQSGQLLVEQRWTFDQASGQRVRSSEQLQPILPQRPVRVELTFNKPMRYRNSAGQIAQLPGNLTDLQPRVTVLRDGQSTELDTSAGQWQGNAGFHRYRDDTFVFEYLPASVGEASLRVATADMVGLALDADPATPVDWVDGAWSEWEDIQGIDGDFGGFDSRTASINVSVGASPEGIRVVRAPSVVGEGDALRVTLQRDASNSPTVLLQGSVDGGAMETLVWNAGESGDRLFELPVAEDVLGQGERDLAYRIEALVGVDLSAVPVASGTVRVLDNDRPGASVLRVRRDLVAALSALTASNEPTRELVLDGGRNYPGPSGMLTVCMQHELIAPLRVYGNRAALVAAEGACNGPRVSGNGSVELFDMQISGLKPGAAGGTVPGLIGGGADLQLKRVRLGPTLGSALRYSGDVRIQNSSIADAVALPGSAALLDIDGSLRIDASTLHNNRSSAALLAVRPNGNTLSHLRDSSLIGNQVAGELLPAALRVGTSLIQANQVSGATACSAQLQSEGFTIYDGSDCPLQAEGDRLATALQLGSAQGPDAAYYLPQGAAADAGGSCGAVDQRGAPRAQSINASIRCDSGAVEQGVNPWRGFWQPSRDGHGIDMQTAGNTLFILWYTYADDGQPVAYQAAAPLTGAQWSAELLLASRDPASAVISNRTVGTVSLDFASDTEARLGWRFDDRGVQGSEQLRALAFAAGEPRVEVTGTWYPPAESGNGASIARRGETTAMALYYYDAAGALRWALGSGDGGDAVDIELFSYTGFCPDCDAQLRPVSQQPAGRALLHFLTPRRLRLDSDVSYPGAAGGQWSRQRADFEPLSDAVDNRTAAAALTH